MGLYLGVDGGGTKCCALLFDDSYRPLGYGVSGGVNTNFTTLEDCRRNMDECVRQALAGYEQPTIETLYALVIGPKEELVQAVSRRATLKETVSFGEGQAGILAGAQRPYGLLAMSGTGSDVFYMRPDGYQAVIGGFGAILGDQGSGAWIGQQALRAVVAMGEGWGEETLMREMLFEAWGIAEKWEMATRVYGAAAPFRVVASCVPIAARAAKMGDQTALRIFREAGAWMARQMTALIRREHIPEEEQFCVCCGGAWKAHPAMYESFVKQMGADAPAMAVEKPRFEHVMAGPTQLLLDRRPGIDPDAASRILSEGFPKLKITW